MGTAKPNLPSQTVWKLVFNLLFHLDSFLLSADLKWVKIANAIASACAVYLLQWTLEPRELLAAKKRKEGEIR
jgi:hypothetical protein